MTRSYRVRPMRDGEQLPGSVIDVGEQQSAAPEPRGPKTRAAKSPPNKARAATQWLDIIGVGILAARVVTTIANRMQDAGDEQYDEYDDSDGEDSDYDDSEYDDEPARRRVTRRARRGRR